jgi:hypothetical protein
MRMILRLWVPEVSSFPVLFPEAGIFSSSSSFFLIKLRYLKISIKLAPSFYLYKIYMFPFSILPSNPNRGYFKSEINMGCHHLSTGEGLCSESDA